MTLPRWLLKARARTPGKARGGKFPCPYCPGGTAVIDSRPSSFGSPTILRRRVCVECGRRFTTREVILQGWKGDQPPPPPPPPGKPKGDCPAP